MSFDNSQPRDKDGKWSSSGLGGGSFKVTGLSYAAATAPSSFKRLQKVKNNHGKVLTVIAQKGNRVSVLEHSTQYHPSKLHAISNSSFPKG